MKKHLTLRAGFALVLSVAIAGNSASAQSWLQKPVTLTVQRKPLGSVLKELESRSGASFSYNSNTVPTDSLVSISVQGGTLNSALGKLLGDAYEYRERGSHVVIRPAGDGDTYSITGYIFDRETGSVFSMRLYMNRANWRRLLPTNTAISD